MAIPQPRLCERSLTAKEAEKIASEIFCIDGILTEFRGEREQIYQIGAPDMPMFVLRIADHHESLDGIRLQNAVLKHIECRRLDIDTPRVRASKKGEDLEEIDVDGRQYFARMLTYVPGISAEGVSSSKSLLMEVGVALARLDLALSDFPAVPTPHPLIWRMETSPQLGQYVDLIPTVDQRRMVLLVLEEFKTRSLPLFGELRTQIIHNDFNPRNVLVDPQDNAHVRGVIDFSDLTQSAMIVDLAVAAARHANSTDPLRSMATIVEAYEQLVPLTALERHLLLNLICMRLAMVMLIWSYRLATYKREEANTAVESAFELMNFLTHARASKSLPRVLMS